VITREIQDAILAEYDQRAHLYQALAPRLSQLLKLLLQEKVQLHSITERCKERASLSRKLAKPDKRYATLSEVTDVAAVRIITYFPEDVDAVATIIEDEFRIDSDNSTDKRKYSDPERFGYASLHYVGQFSEARCRLAEYSPFAPLKFEIQVRSILQHAWAEIEHDLGYKSKAGVPRAIRRRFSRIAGLLELADDEFAAIRKGLLRYQSEVAEQISETPEAVGVDRDSLKALVESEDSDLYKLARQVAAIAQASIVRFEDTLDDSARLLAVLEISNVAQLESLAREYFEQTVKFARRFLADSDHHTILPSTVGIFYLWYVLVATRANGDVTRLKTYLQAGLLTATESLVSRVTNAFESSQRD